MALASPLRSSIDWGSLAPLRLRARAVAEGVYAGVHRSARRGAGVEFGGFREYSAGDDLRWLDRRALLLHDRLVVRQFETETDRALRVVVDGTASMGYRGSRAPGAKLAFASLLAAALARLAVASGDPAGLVLLGGEGAKSVPLRGGREQFERIVAALESNRPGGDARAPAEAASILGRALDALARGSRRGSIVVFLSDLLDLPDEAPERVSALASRGRVLVVVQVLDPDELTFPFDGTVRLRAMEGDFVVETDAVATRQRYLSELEALRRAWETRVAQRGGRFVRASTDEDPVAVVRRVVGAVR